ncbi:MAG: sigma-70 family RNA polymerase sigma factor [Agarilytica sp.]
MNTPNTAQGNGQKRDDNWSNLLTQVGLQDESAFAEVFAHFAPLIKGFCQSNKTYLGGDAAEELVQEVMIKVWQKASNFDPTRASASTWIYTIARNTRIDYLRKHAKHDVNSSPVETEDIWDESSDNQPFVFMKRSREEKEVAQLLEALPAEQIRCIEKVYMEGKSQSEIAEELDLPLGTVKSRVRLGLKKLQSQSVIN